MSLSIQASTRAVFGVLVAIAITTAMDANGLSAFSALPLFPLMALFWYLERLSGRSMGFVLGRWRHYGMALLHPALVVGAIVIISVLTRAVDFSHTDWRKASLHSVLISASTTLVVILTEEGFFRGWLWASLERAGKSRSAVLVWTSIAFSLWHLSAVTLETGFDLPAAQVPVFMGAAWGLARAISGSVIVASVSHGVWNGMVYPLFGFGTKVGALGIRNTAVYGPEMGWVGLALNIAFVAILWRFWKARSRT